MIYDRTLQDPIMSHDGDDEEMDDSENYSDDETEIFRHRETLHRPLKVRLPSWYKDGHLKIDPSRIQGIGNDYGNESQDSQTDLENDGDNDDSSMRSHADCSQCGVWISKIHKLSRQLDENAAKLKKMDQIEQELKELKDAYIQTGITHTREMLKKNKTIRFVKEKNQFLEGKLKQMNEQWTIKKNNIEKIDEMKIAEVGPDGNEKRQENDKNNEEKEIINGIEMEEKQVEEAETSMNCASSILFNSNVTWMAVNDGENHKVEKKRGRKSNSNSEQFNAPIETQVEVQAVGVKRNRKENKKPEERERDKEEKAGQEKRGVDSVKKMVRKKKSEIEVEEELGMREVRRYLERSVKASQMSVSLPQKEKSMEESNLALDLSSTSMASNSSQKKVFIGVFYESILLPNGVKKGRCLLCDNEFSRRYVVKHIKKVHKKEYEEQTGEDTITREGEEGEEKVEEEEEEEEEEEGESDECSEEAVGPPKLQPQERTRKRRRN